MVIFISLLLVVVYMDTRSRIGINHLTVVPTNHNSDDDDNAEEDEK